jgi:methylmalonyl-CoA/ethylmalonyl-CoA epimerase
MEDYTLHHVGLVVGEIGKTAELYGKLLGLDVITSASIDEAQGVKVAFLEAGNGVKLELVEPIGNDSPVMDFAKKGGGLHHLCYEVSNLNDAVQNMWRQGAIIVRDPSPALALDGRNVAFLYSPDRSLIELLETQKDRAN